MIFLEAAPGKPPRRLSAPFDAQACTTQYGRFGHAFGQPLFMVGGRVGMTGLARNYTISAWQGRGKGWTQPCELKLAFDQRLQISGSYCSSDTSLCKAAKVLAPAIVTAYDRQSSLEPLAFAKGRQPPEALSELLGDNSDAPLEFPTFGAKTKGTANPFLTSFSYAQAPARTALWMDRRWWLGVVGVAGIGWRESTTSLVVIYAVTDAGPVPAASFQVEKVPAGPARARWQ